MAVLGELGHKLPQGLSLALVQQPPEVHEIAEGDRVLGEGWTKFLE